MFHVYYSKKVPHSLLKNVLRSLLKYSILITQKYLTMKVQKHSKNFLIMKLLHVHDVFDQKIAKTSYNNFEATLLSRNN